MLSICFYFQVHQPYRIQNYRFFDIGRRHNYFYQSGNNINKDIFKKVAYKCYLPTNEILYNLLAQYPDFKISFSLSGVFLEQALRYQPEVIRSFQKLIKTGQVEILSETYYHSLSFLYSIPEFDYQVKKHKRLVKKLFGVTPTTFRNTELIYNNDLAKHVETLGYNTVLTEGADHILSWKSPNYVYTAQSTQGLKVLMKNYSLSDDIAFRFSSQDWDHHPLTSQTYARWIHQHHGKSEVINLFMDYETFGEHQWEYSGIFEFLKHLPKHLSAHPDTQFLTPSEVSSQLKPVGIIDVPDYISWADQERDLSAWRSNPMQWDAFKQLYDIEHEIKQSKKKTLIEDWRKLQTSDHFYYMCTKFWQDGDVHKYFSPYKSPYEAFIFFMNSLQDIKIRLKSLRAE